MVCTHLEHKRTVENGFLSQEGITEGQQAVSVPHTTVACVYLSRKWKVTLIKSLVQTVNVR